MALNPSNGSNLEQLALKGLNLFSENYDNQGRIMKTPLDNMLSCLTQCIDATARYREKTELSS